MEDIILYYHMTFKVLYSVYIMYKIYNQIKNCQVTYFPSRVTLPKIKSLKLKILPNVNHDENCFWLFDRM